MASQPPELPDDFPEDVPPDDPSPAEPDSPDEFPDDDPEFGEPEDTVEDVYEPFLIQQGLLMRTPKGRVATPAAFGHLGLTSPPGGRANALFRD